MKKSISVLLTFLIFLSNVFLFTNGAQAAGENSMAYSYTGWNYGYKGTVLNGYIPALQERTTRPWELVKWKAVYHYSDGNTKIQDNYDVMNIKKKFQDDNYDKENGFGLVNKSSEALGDLIEIVYAPVKGKLSTKQWNYFKDKFTSAATDPTFNSDNEFFYTLDNQDFLRTSGVITRMGAKFDRTEKVSESDRRAHFEVSAWPELTVKNVGSKIVLDYTANGYSPRRINVVAVPQGGWLDGKTAKITAVRTEAFGPHKPDKPIEMESNQIAYLLGVDKEAKVDFIIDDGYGRTKIVPGKLSGFQWSKIDFMASDILLDGQNQLTLKFKYWGDDLSYDDLKNLVTDKGIPMKAVINVTGAIKLDVTNDKLRWAILKEHPKGIKNGEVFSYPIGKVDLSKVKSGKVTIKATGTVDDPKSPLYVQEMPDGSEKNNSITKTFNLTLGDEDLAAYSISASPNPITKGKTATVTGKVINKGKTNQQNVLIRFYVDEKQVHQTRKNMPVNEIVTTTFDWQANRVGEANLKIVVDPLEEKEDRDRSNNMKYVGVICKDPAGGNNGGSGSCTKKPSGTWDVDYLVITGYRTKSTTVTYTDPTTGKTTTRTEDYTDYNDPIWGTKKVSYNERVTATVTANTKQGIETSKKNPKESDRESRGSWEIIPYAKKKGIDPNLITRAGYGFELKANISYQTDWETKVPNTANPFGGKYSGPSQVYALVYNTKGNLMKRIEMEKTGTTTWELPRESYTFSTGEKIVERKVYTDEKWPDGAFTVRIMADLPNSRTGLSVCEPITLYIYGSMYDDLQNVLQPK
ncbi:hypothetical protein J6TS7_20760 [Paenibacillus dendritiformis]|uniref:CARDB domain-containing protein n=1 Tax=Paenibacillus TaxID=44249 RepID=UPI001B18FA77|nr:CARDB domain-containing protein [Paenibacillus dendritiformis]GIO78466.1 hypothetical protein J6TS7_20760 [Paenibacillus dendritiformis]